MNKSERKAARKSVVLRHTLLLCAGLLWAGTLAGCKDLFHEKTEDNGNGGSNGGGDTYYTVTFNADGGSPSTQTKSVRSGGSVGYYNMPSDPTRSGYILDGWWSSRNGNGSRFTYETTVYNNMTVYAGWTTGSLPANLSLAESLTWIDNNAVEGGEYTITLNSAATIAPKTLYYGGNTVNITLTGATTERTVSLSSNGSLFTVESGVTLTLGNNVTLQGRSNNTAVLVYVNGGTLVMNNGSKITGNTNYVYSSSDYAYVYGSGVYVLNGKFTMNGGEISGNTAHAVSASSYAGVWGGGVHINGNTAFIMNGGRISGNTARISGSSSSFIDGAGIDMLGGDFTMNGGEISGNIISSQSGGRFTGGGIYFCYGTFTMNGGTISGNGSSTVSGLGGGVFFGYDNDTFIMRGGTISGNAATSGGGVYVYNNSTFTKQSGGVIYGSNESNSTLRNTAAGSSDGHAVYVSSSPAKIRNTTAGSGITLNSRQSGSAGGWESIGSISNITYSSVSGGTWTLLGDGGRRSPAIGNSSVTKARISFTSNVANASITIQLEVSSEENYDYAFISTLDNTNATYESGYYTGSLISGTRSVTVTIPVPTAGSHFIDVGYRKDGSQIGGSDCAWFKVLE
jgi:hypothetical protein